MSHTIKAVHVNFRTKLYLSDNEQCERCFEYTVPKHQQAHICSHCTEYVEVKKAQLALPDTDLKLGGN